MMPSVSLHDLIPVLQIAIGPVILVSGVSLFLLTLTNRFGRAIDRSRALVREHRESPAAKQHLTGEVEILYRRARLIRLSIMAAATALLLASALIIALFVTALMRWEAGLLISVIFILAMLALIVSLAAFMKDIHVSLAALALELELGKSGPSAMRSTVAASKSGTKMIEKDERAP
jgi:uncharacterized protein DUF2721